MGADLIVDLNIFRMHSSQYGGSVRADLHASEHTPMLHGRLVDCTAVRDDAAVPRLTVPNNRDR
jgi:hypothetical protein